MDTAIGYVCLVLLFVLVVFFLLRTKHENELINKAAEALSIPDRFIPYLKNSLLSLYKHQPTLKYWAKYSEKYGNDTFLLLVQQNDKLHYQCIIEKLHTLAQREEDYGEGFIDTESWAHYI